MGEDNKTEIIYTRMTPKEREMLNWLTKSMVRGRSEVVRFLVRSEYARRQENNPQENNPQPQN
jgi:hypothetical protein